MARPSKIQKFLSCFDEKGHTQDLLFREYLDKTNEKGVNDFSVPFHRDPYDYCDGYFVIVKVLKKYNLVYYNWSQYSGYHYQLCSTIWFDKIFVEEGRLLGHSHRYRYNHIEFDYNSGRGWCGSLPSLLKVMLNSRYSFIYLRESFKDNLITDKWFDAVISDWKDGDGGKVCIVSINNKEYKFNTDGALIEKEKNLKVALAVAQEAFKTKPKIASDWIDKDRPCAFRYGFAYKGANTRIISKAEALDKLRLHSFGNGFYTMDFEIIQSIGDVALVFCELSESDMF